MGADVNYAGPRTLTPLMWAAKNDHEEVIEYLLENGAKINPKSKNPKSGEGNTLIKRVLQLQATYLFSFENCLKFAISRFPFNDPLSFFF